LVARLVLTLVAAIGGLSLVGSVDARAHAPQAVRHVNSVGSYSYDPAGASTTLPANVALVSASVAGRSTTADGSVALDLSRLLAAEEASASRGLSNLGGVFSSQANGAGGTVATSVGDISQNDVAPLVNSGMYRGDVNIITGVHGLADGTTVADASLYDADVARFGDLAGVVVHNLPDMAPGQISDLLNGEGTTIGAFCNSAACLAPFR
jgi:hypothetical protein